MDQDGDDEPLPRSSRGRGATRLDAVIDTFTTDCYLETVCPRLPTKAGKLLGRPTSGTSTAFPDLAPEDQGFATGEDVLVSWGMLRGTSGGEWLGVAPSGGSFAVQFTNVSTFKDGHMHGENDLLSIWRRCASRPSCRSTRSELRRARGPPRLEQRPPHLTICRPDLRYRMSGRAAMTGP